VRGADMPLCAAAKSSVSVRFYRVRFSYIDRIFVDESDLYKNPGFTSKMTRIAGLPNTESNRALDIYMKTRYLAERNGGIVFATGTPISNTMAEVYTLQRYLAPETLKAAGVEYFDAWAANFGEPVTALELAPDGSGYRMHTSAFVIVWPWDSMESTISPVLRVSVSATARGFTAFRS
jgi:N12 class adenine-specific DNA methylase